MQKLNFKDSLVVGVDVHKASNTAVLITPFGEEVDRYEFEQEEEDFEKFYERIKEKAEETEVYYALEDTEGKGLRLSRYLMSKGCSVYSVPAVYTERERRRSTHLEKTDWEDAKRVAEVLLIKSDKLPKVMISKRSQNARELKELSTDRNELVAQRTRIKNQLHEILNQIYGSKYREEVRYKDMFCPKAIKEWRSKLKDGKNYRSKRAYTKFKMLEMLREDIELIEDELEKIGEQSEDIKILSTMKGIGKIISSETIGEIKDIGRFRSPAALAKYAGIAPREHSSGGHVRHYTDFRGNRQLNKSFHKLALSLIGINGTKKAKRYYQRKISEGKSKLHALRCLKRQLVNIVYCMLKDQKPYSLLEKEL